MIEDYKYQTMKIDSVYHADCRQMQTILTPNSVDVCIADPPYNYEFIGREWDIKEIERRLTRVGDSGNKTLVKNIPYGSGLAGGVRNPRWYKKNRENIVGYTQWCEDWAKPLYETMKPGAYVAVFNSTRTVAHVQVALENVGFYARDILVYRRHSGIPKGLNAVGKLSGTNPDLATKYTGYHSALRNEWEAICLLQKPLTNNYMETIQKYGTGLMLAEDGQNGFQSNILEGLNKGEELDIEVEHCTVKPVRLLKKLVKLLAPPDKNALILDPFCGSGTTLVAAKALGYHFVGFDLIKKYVEISRGRLEAMDSTERLKMAQ